MALGILESSDIGDELFSEALEGVAEPLPGVKVAPQPSRGQQRREGSGCRSAVR